MVTFEMDNPLINERGDNGYEKLLQSFLQISFRIEYLLLGNNKNKVYEQKLLQLNIKT